MSHEEEIVYVVKDLAIGELYPAGVMPPSFMAKNLFVHTCILCSVNIL